MFLRSLARLVTALALLAASVAWAGWVFLHTVGDPNRSPAVARSVLADPVARQELSADVASALADAANHAIATAAHGSVAVRVDGHDPALRAAVDAALADPRVVTSVVDALAAEQSGVLGVTPAHPASIDTGVLVEAVRQHLATSNPALASALPALPAGAVKLPTVDIPLARRLRLLATTWVGRSALAAAAGLALAFALAAGGRLRVVRAAGVWGIGAGLSWVVLPRVASWAADHWLPGHHALVRAVLRGATGPVNAVAATLVSAGVAAVVASVVLARLPALRSGSSGLEGGGDGATRPGSGAGPGQGRSGRSGWSAWSGWSTPIGGRPSRGRRRRQAGAERGPGTGSGEHQPVDAYL